MQLEADDARLRQRFAALIDGIPQLVWASKDGGQWTWASPRWSERTGLTNEMSRGLGWLDAVHPDDRATVQAAWREATFCGVLDVEHRLLSPDRSGDGRWFRTRSTPSPGDGGQGREWLGTCTDVHDASLLAQCRQCTPEMQWRRVLDILALTRSVVRRTARASGILEDVALHLDGRLDAIARTQSMTVREPRVGVDLEHLVTDALLAHAAHEGEWVHVSGPSVSLRGKTAALVGLALHELAMNAVEHGALRVPQGGIAVTWRLEGRTTGRVLRFEWLETGVPAPSLPFRRDGFGTQWIERVLSRELGVTASLGFGLHGVCCRIALPLLEDGVASSLRVRTIR